MRFLKKLHKWVGLIIGLQVTLWVLSGLMISLIDPVKVSGRQWAISTPHELEALPPGALLEPDELPAAILADALSVKLTEHLWKHPCGTSAARPITTSQSIPQ